MCDTVPVSSTEALPTGTAVGTIAPVSCVATGPGPLAGPPPSMLNPRSATPMTTTPPARTRGSRTDRRGRTRFAAPAAGFGRPGCGVAIGRLTGSNAGVAWNAATGWKVAAAGVPAATAWNDAAAGPPAAT